MTFASLIRTAPIALALSLALLGPLPASAQTITADNVGEMAANAKTAADHTAIAAYFHEQAKAAMAQVQKHRAMLATPMGNKPSGSVWDAHCRRLIKSYQEQAEAYSDLAKEQEVLAKHVAETH